MRKTLLYITLPFLLVSLLFPCNSFGKETNASNFLWIENIQSEINGLALLNYNYDDFFLDCECPDGASTVVSGTYTTLPSNTICIAAGETVTFNPDNTTTGTVIVYNCGTFNFSSTDGPDNIVLYAQEGSESNFDTVLVNGIMAEVESGAIFNNHNGQSTCESISVYRGGTYVRDGYFNGSSYTLYNQGTANLDFYDSTESAGIAFQATTATLVTGPLATTTFSRTSGNVSTVADGKTTSFTTFNQDASAFSTISDDFENDYTYTNVCSSGVDSPLAYQTDEVCGDGIDNNWDGVIDEGCEDCTGDNTLPGCDFDGDGISNFDDLDDDNDGVPDVEECKDVVYIDADFFNESGNITGFPRSFSNVSGITGFDVTVETEGTFDGTSPYISSDGTFNNEITTFNGATNSFIISFPGSVQPGSITITSENNLFARLNTNTTPNQRINERLLFEILGQGEVTGETKIFDEFSCSEANYRAPDIVDTGSEASHMYNMPLVALANSCGVESVFNASAGITQLRVTYSLPNGASNNATTLQSFRITMNMCYTDTDGDGVANKFDLDSDGDGCSDAIEAGATTDTTTDFQFTGVDSNVDGLVDAVDSDQDEQVDYESTYNQLAMNSNAGFCIDSDGDGVLDTDDIDDDNDGVLDVDEACADGLSTGTPFTSISQASSVTSAGIYYFNIGGQEFSTYVDENGYVKIAIDFGGGSGALPQGNALNNNERGILTPEILALLDIEEVRISDSTGFLDATTTNAGVIDRVNINFIIHRGQGDNGINDDWVGSNAQVLTVNGTSNTNVGSPTLDRAIIHISGNANGMSWIPITNRQAVQNTNTELSPDESLNLWVKGGEAVFEDGNGNCDIDGDGLPNHLDPDADGDGCSDALEASATTDTTTDFTFDIEGGSSTDANGNGLADEVEDGTTGNNNYQSTYALYGLNKNIGICLDSDNDGVIDFIDIDDDNDGILDEDENCQNGLTPSTPFSSITQARFVQVPGVYYFEIDDVPFSSYVDENGYVLVAYDYPTGGGNIPLTNNVNTMDRGVFPPEVLAVLDNLLEVRISDGDGNIDGVSTNATLLTRVQGNLALHRGNAGDNGINSAWTGTNVAPLGRDASGSAGSNNTLDAKIFHTAGNRAGMHWIPASNFQQITNNSGQINATNSLRLWVRGDALGVMSECDYDGDGIENYLDLDSDGDGCSDSFEAGVIDAEVADHQFVFTAGDASDTNGDGLADAVDADLDAETDYENTYNDFAINADRSLCEDSDGDGIPDLIDIDDDNDGVLDVTEQEQCTNTYSEVISGVTSANFNVETSITGQLANGVGYTMIENNDDIRFSSFTTDNTSCLFAKEEYFYEPIVATDVIQLVAESGNDHQFIIQFDQQVNNVIFNISSIDQRALTFTGVGLSGIEVLQSNDQLTVSGNTIGDVDPGSYDTVVCEDNGGSASGSILLKGNYQTIGVTFTSNGTLNDGMAFQLSEYCFNDLDTDGDGTVNRLDLDSDEDGCSDAFEALATKDLTENYQFEGTDANENGLDDEVENGTTGEINYESEYETYAIDDTENACLDSDGDTIPDVYDLDDDNDGILDSDEGCLQIRHFFTDMTTLATSTRSTSDALLTDWVYENPNDPGNWSLNLEFNVEIELIIESILGDQSFARSGTATVDGVTKNFSTAGGESQVVEHSSSSKELHTITYVGQNLPLNGLRVYDADRNPIIFYDFGMPTSPVEDGYYGVSNNNPDETQFVCGFGGDLGDIDGDGIPNRLDLDSDGDGCSDAFEGAGDFVGSQLVASEMDGGNTDGIDSTFNGYGSPVVENLGNNVDLDPSSASYGVPIIAGTGQAIGTSQELAEDLDGDGVGDDCDCFDYTQTDTDGDGVPDYADVDADNDGIDNITESTSGVDPYLDGDADDIPFYLDDDDTDELIGNDDGVIETGFDTDEDGVPNHLDLDSDNDGIPDAVEAQADYTVANNLTNCRFDDGDVFNTEGCETGESAGGLVTPVDTDGDGTPDYLDLDSDDDTCPDGIESGSSETTVNTTDYTTVDTASIDTATGLVTAVGCVAPENDNWVLEDENDACCEIDETTLTATPTSPSTCSPANDGSILIQGGNLSASTDYRVTYTKDGTDEDPVVYTTATDGSIEILGLEPGEYTDITIASVANPTTCFGTISTIITITPFTSDLEASETTVTNVLCTGEATGSIDILVSGGNGSDYSFEWITADGTIPSGQEIVEDPSGLSVGTYSVTVTDNITLCEFLLEDIAITEPAAALTASATETTAVA
ncbi:hypothetical protein JMA43_12450, partial [Joostella sp. CR20]